jgi:hypothetical protein
MDDKMLSNKNGRRDFISLMVSGTVATCFCCKTVIAGAGVDSPEASGRQKFLVESGMSYEQVFNFGFRNWFIRYMKGLEAEIGKDKLLKMLKKVGWALYEESIKRNFRHLKKRDVESLIRHFWAPMQKSRLWSHTLPVEIIKQKPMEGVVKMSQCLVAKTFLENNAGDIGYAAICHADFAVANAFNPNIKLTRNQCLMKGDKCCLFEYTLHT